MDGVMAWAKENFDLIVLLVSFLGVFVSIISVIYEIRKKKKGKK